MKRNGLIVTADDFGLRPSANERIMALVRIGVVDRVAVMVDGLISSSERDELLRCGVALDVHLDVDIRKSAGKRPSEGVFKRLIEFVFSFLSGRLRPRFIRREWERQADRFVELFGRNPDGLNSHEYLHFFPAYLPLILGMADRRGIGYVRFGTEGIHEPGHPVAFILQALNILGRRRFVASGIRSSTVLVSLDWVRDKARLIASPPEGDIEVIIHPERDEEFDLMRSVGTVRKH